MEDKNKKAIILLLIFTIIFTVIGSSFAYLRWQTSSGQQTSVTFTVANEFSCSADGGNDLTSNSVLLEPTTCDDSASAIKREITLKPKIDNEDLNIYMDVWLDVVRLDEGLKNSENFKWVLSTSPTSCNGSAVKAQGTFNGIEKDDKVLILDGKTYTNTTNDKYYLYIWLDKEETSPTTMNQKFEFNLNGECGMGVKPKTFTYEQISSNYSCANNSIGTNPIFTYTGDCEVVDDGDENWKVRFLTSGTFISLNNTYIDAFLVGGGGGGSNGGGGGGYTNTTFVSIDANNEYDIVLGSGGSAGKNGDDTTAFSAIAFGGFPGNGSNGGNGGSGGGSYISGKGGSNGNSGGSGDNGLPGSGQGRTTCEFGESGCTNDLLYGGGGGGYAYTGTPGTGGSGGGGSGSGRGGTGNNGVKNTGGGGGGGATGGAGGSGIVIIRNTRNNSGIEQLPSVGFDFEYTGNYIIINDEDENWRIKFLTSGTFTSSVDLQIDAFLVGGGGGGSNSGGGGGGGYTNTTFVSIDANNDYDIVVGAGGAAGIKGEDTTAFSAIANGGSSGDGNNGGTGGSGGGAYLSGKGGSNGNSGGYGGNGSPGSGQGRITCEFGEIGCTNDLLYGGGGGGGTYVDTRGAGGSGGGGTGGKLTLENKAGFGVVNTGGGGGGGWPGGSGGSGIVIIRNTRNSSGIEHLPSVGFDFKYTGNYIIINDEDENWRIKFLTSGTFTSSVDLQIDAFLVGGGGGGSNGGGGGGYTNTTFVSIDANNDYDIVVGAGGGAGIKGDDTTAFSAIANGGFPGSGSNGGNGGSGGGSYISGNGGSNGNSGGNGGNGSPGSGQGRTTCEFGEVGCTNDLLYGGGGGAEANNSTPGTGGSGGGGMGGKYTSEQKGVSGVVNTGGGGGGGHGGGSGASGIVIIRNYRIS